MVILIATVFLLFHSILPAVTVSRIKCEDLEDCNTCYAKLVSEIFENDRNLFEIQNQFFPPDRTSPSFMTVSYEFESGEQQVWYWSEAYFYLLHPLHVFQFTSLFFSDTNMESSNVSLFLPSNCSKLEDRYLMLLTQRLKLYAVRSSITSPIPDDYNPVAQSDDTISAWHNNSMAESKFISSHFIVFPFFTILLLICAVFYFNDFIPNNRSEKIRKILAENTTKASFLKWDLQNEFILSLLITMYILALSAAAVQFSTDTETHLNSNVKAIFSIDPSIVDVFQQRLTSSLPIITFTIDLIIFAIMISSGGMIATSYAFDKICFGKKYNSCSSCFWICFPLLLILGILFIVVGYEMLGFQYSLGLGITYIILAPLTTICICPLIIYCIRSIYCIRCIYFITKPSFLSIQHSMDTPMSTPSISTSSMSLWRYCVYSILFPLCCIANHLNYIIIAFIHDLYHATSVAIVYGVVVLFFYGFLKQVSYLIGNPKYLIEKCKYQLIKEFFMHHYMVVLLIIKLTLILFLSGYVAFSILLYVFLPIDNEFDTAANHFISIYQTVFLFLTAMATYFLINKPFRSPISIFTKAESEYNVMGMKDQTGGKNTPNQRNEEWDNLTDKERDLLMTRKILSILKKQEESLLRSEVTS